jgi:uncharacterized protein DUF3987
MPNQFSNEDGAKSLQLQASNEQINNIQNQDSPEKVPLPTIRHTDNLPILLKKGIEKFREEFEKDLFLFSTLTVCSGLLTKVSGIYRQEKAYPNLFLLVVAPPASGKSAMMHSRRLISKIHDRKYKEAKQLKAEYERKLRERGRRSNAPAPEKPRFNVVLIPANCSSSKIISHLADNQTDDCPSVLIESEIDTLTIAQSNEWGNFSDILRKAFHNEPVSQSRKTGDEYIEVTSPKLAVALSGTLNQVKTLINNSEDGLYSRFLVYAIDSGGLWFDVSPCDTCPNLTEVFEEQADEYHDFWEFISKEPFEVLLTQDQWVILNTAYKSKLSEIKEYVNPNCTGLVKRHGIMLFKLCLVLTAFRKYERKLMGKEMICQKEDFETALYLAGQSLEHSLNIFEQLPGGNKQAHDAKNKIYDRLLPRFTYSEAVEIGHSLQISDRTVERYLKSLIKRGALVQPERGKYQKPMSE